jgi:hypothetical protein
MIVRVRIGGEECSEPSILTHITEFGCFLFCLRNENDKFSLMANIAV